MERLYYVYMLLKILPVVLVVTLIGGGLVYYFRFYKPGNLANTSTNTPIFNLSNSGTPDERITNLNEAMQGVLSDISKIKNDFSSFTIQTTQKFASSEARLNTIEGSIKDLKSRVGILETKVSVSPSGQGGTTVTPPSYIPLGSGGSQGDRNYLVVPGYVVTINPANYPGYSSMVLEVNANLVQNVGQANFQLFNTTTNSAVSNSQVSTQATSNAFIQSNGFTVSAGSNTYVLQAQSTQGYTIQVQNARIRVNF